MTKEEMKNRISLALKDPILQQGFEVICKENAKLTKDNETLTKVINNVHVVRIKQLTKENAGLKEKYDTCLRENTGLKIHNAYVEKKLTTAKEIIKKLKALYLSPVVTKDDVKRQDEILAEAEQFLFEELLREEVPSSNEKKEIKENDR